MGKTVIEKIIEHNTEAGRYCDCKCGPCHDP